MSPGGSSRQRYREFVAAYRAGELRAEGTESPEGLDAAAPRWAFWRSGRTRAYLRDYLRWLKPHRGAIASVLLLALVVASLDMIEPLFMRYIIDRVLLDASLDTASRVTRLHLAGGLFLAVVIASRLVGMLKEYRQRRLDARVRLTLRRSLFDRCSIASCACRCRSFGR